MTPLTTPTILSRLLADAADRRSDHPAVIDLGAVTTWAQADDRAGRMAAALVEAGVGRGDRVGVHYRKSTDAFLAMHATVRIGAIAVPLDPTASASYLATVARLTGCSVVLTHQPCARSANRLAAEAGVVTVIGIDAPTGDDPATTTGTGEVPRYVPAAAYDALAPTSPVSVDPDDPSYLITTSGSTGTPKSMCHTHGSAIGHVRTMTGVFDVNLDDRFADIAPNHFDISCPALWITPTLAATNVVVPEPYQMLPASAAQLVEEQRISVWYSVPYLLAQLHHRGAIDERDLSSLRLVLFGGEVFPPGVLARLMERLPQARFGNCYGPAEVNVCTAHLVDGPPAADEPVPIGTAMPGVRIRLATIDPGPDEVGAEVPDGTQGEIWVNGPTTMRGYWERPDLTEPSMVDDDDGRWYRTGDVGWRRPDGLLMFAGRLDHQVKVRGHRVELESIEAVLEDAPGVEYAVATVVRADDGSDVLVAGVRMADDLPLPDNLPGALAEHLPMYAVPQSVVPLHSAPTTGSGKLDRRALRSALSEQSF